MPKNIQHAKNLNTPLNLNRRFDVASEKCEFIKLNLYVFYFKSNFTIIKVCEKNILVNNLKDSYIVNVDFNKKYYLSKHILL